MVCTTLWRSERRWSCNWHSPVPGSGEGPGHHHPPCHLGAWSTSSPRIARSSQGECVHGSWSGETAENVYIESRSFRDRPGSSSKYRETPKICSPACMARPSSGRVNAFLCVGGIMSPACPCDAGLGCSGRNWRCDSSQPLRWRSVDREPCVSGGTDDACLTGAMVPQLQGARGGAWARC